MDLREVVKAAKKAAEKAATDNINDDVILASIRAAIAPEEKQQLKILTVISSYIGINTEIATCLNRFKEQPFLPVIMVIDPYELDANIELLQTLSELQEKSKILAAFSICQVFQSLPPLPSLPTKDKTLLLLLSLIIARLQVMLSHHVSTHLIIVAVLPNESFFPQLPTFYCDKQLVGIILWFFYQYQCFLKEHSLS